MSLVIVVLVSLALQVLTQHTVVLEIFLKTETVSLPDGFLLLALGTIPSIVLEIVKVVRYAGDATDNSHRSQSPSPFPAGRDLE